ncbi:PRC-barrel domain-containing protein [[Eubacterium] cellulosolvens]
MLEEVTSLLGLQIYTQYGVFVGVINNVIVDLRKHRAESLYVEQTNPTLVEDSRSITIPFRWVQNVGDIVLLRHFPEHIELSDEQRRMFELDEMRFAEMAPPPEE